MCGQEEQGGSESRRLGVTVLQARKRGNPQLVFAHEVLTWALESSGIEWPSCVFFLRLIRAGVSFLVPSHTTCKAVKSLPERFVEDPTRATTCKMSRTVFHCCFQGDHSCFPGTRMITSNSMKVDGFGLRMSVIVTFLGPLA